MVRAPGITFVTTEQLATGARIDSNRDGKDQEWQLRDHMQNRS